MADNYLENKMAEFREGRTVVRRPSASLESLLKNAGGMISPPDHLTGGSTPSNTPAAPGLPTSPNGSVPASAVRPEGRREPIMPVQVQAVARAAQQLGEAKSFRIETDEKEGIIRLLGPSSPRKCLLDAGQLILAMRLKAAELHLGCDVKIQPESTAPANPLIATLKLYKNGQKNSSESE